MRLGKLTSLIFKRKETMPVTIPPVPEGVLNPGNLYNDANKHLPPLAWSNPDLHARLAWIATQVGYTITAWYTPINQGPPGFPAMVMPTKFRAEVAPGVGTDIELDQVMQRPDAVVYTLMVVGNPNAMPSGLKPYPGYAALYPATDSPIGAAWPDHPWKGLRMFRDIGGDKFKVGDEFETAEAKYKKVSFQVRPGSGPFGTGGEMGTAWQLVYSR